MTIDDLKYESLLKIISPYLAKGRTESATFLNWFLENLYRLDETAADDSICDAQNDKGVDGVYVDTNNEEIHFFQAKIRQKANGTIGDVDVKTFSASVQQFSTPEKIDVILQGNADDTLKKILSRLDVKDLLSKGYRPVGIYVTNELSDAITNAYLAIDENIRVFDRKSISENYIEADQGVGVEGDFTFDITYVEPLKMSIGGEKGGAPSTVYMFPALATELVALDGISDTTLFTKNVRYDLGNTSVNKSIRKSIEDKSEHKNFSLYHNGIIILCTLAKIADGKLTISKYSVVNGAQSITTFYKSKNRLSNDLRVLTRVIALNDDTLARKITEYSNNQNAIKPRDLRSNHALMTRLQNEMGQKTKNYFFEIKRGEKAPDGREIITNDIAGRTLLALDLLEPWSSHQIYKVFDEKYSEIFGRVEVNYLRIIFAIDISKIVENQIDKIENKPLAHYALTKYFLIYVLSKILRQFPSADAILRTPANLNDIKSKDFFDRCRQIVANLIIDLNYEVKEMGASFDYKADLKSPKKCDELANTLIRSYEKDLARNKAVGFADF